MDVDILITDDEDAGEGDEDSHVERMIQRDRILVSCQTLSFA